MTRRILLVMGLVLFGAGAGLVGVLSGGTPGGAANPGPSQLPAVQLIAINACTGTAVAGLSAELSLVTAAGGVNPVPIQTVGLTHKWSAAAVPPGTYDLSLSAPGFSGIGDETTGSSPIQVTKNPGPNGLVADSGLVETQVVAVSLVPTIYPPNPCLDLPATAIPQVALQVDDGSSNQVFKDPGPMQFQTPSGGEISPDPAQSPVESFAWSAGSLPAGTYDLSIANAQGYYPLGTSPDGTITPVQVTINPGPSQLPAGDSVNYGISAVASLAPDQPQPTVTTVVPTSGVPTGGTKVTITGTGLLGTYSVDFGTNAATSFSVNATGTKITAYSPASSSGGAGLVEITITTLGGTATHTFTYT